MNVNIPCEVFLRLAKIPLHPVNYDMSNYPNWQSVFLEVTNGHLFAVVTNKKIAAIEYLGEVISPDGSCNICVHPDLIAQCEQEKNFEGSLNIAFNQMLNYAEVSTTFGFQLTYAAVVLPEGMKNEFLNWRTWLPEKLPNKTTDGMYSDLFRLSLLAQAAPSGLVQFQKHIDATVPVIVCDIHEPNWLGVFMSRPETAALPEPCKIPDWINT